MEDGAPPDAIALLLEDHGALRKILEEAADLTRADPPDPARLATCAEAFYGLLSLHERREEEVLFPEVAAMGPVQFVAQEHDRLEGLVEGLKSAIAAARADPSGNAAALRRSLEEVAYCMSGHMMKEEQLVFRMARATLGPERLRDLGSRMAALGGPA